LPGDRARSAEGERERHEPHLARHRSRCTFARLVTRESGLDFAVFRSLARIAGNPAPYDWCT
jgi:hypothetical protein